MTTIEDTFKLSEESTSAGIAAIYRKENSIFVNINLRGKQHTFFVDILVGKLDGAAKQLRNKAKEFLLPHSIPEMDITRIGNAINAELSNPSNYDRLKDLGSAGKAKQGKKGGVSDKLEEEDVQRQLEWDRINAEIEGLRKENPGITFEKWKEELLTLRDNIKTIADTNFPYSWDGIEFTLSVLKILNISECTLPFAGILLARAGGNKTLSSSLIVNWLHVYYVRNFTAKAFVSNNTAVLKDQLPKIDMIPELRWKCFLTPELTPTLSANEDELRENLGIITSVLDGKGYNTHSGAHGRRGYYGNYMFVWVGAAVDIPYRVHKMLATLGPKLYFFRLPYINKTKTEYMDSLNANFESKKKELEDAVTKYLTWFEICPHLLEDKESHLMQVKWDANKDDQQAKEYILNLGELLGRIRGHVETWSSKKNDHEHEYNEFSYSHTQTEDPQRAMQELYNLSRANALTKGRNYILLEDIKLSVKVVLSTAAIERVAILDLLLANDGVLTLSKITTALPMSKSTALNTMTALTALKVVNMDKTVSAGNRTKEIVLRKEFDWLKTDEFTTLRDGFNPVDISEYETMIPEDDN